MDNFCFRRFTQQREREKSGSFLADLSWFKIFVVYHSPRMYVCAKPAIGNTLPQIKSVNLIESEEKSETESETAVGDRNSPRNQYLILYFFSLDSASPRFQFDCFILTFPLVQFSRDSYLLSSFPHALIKIRLLATSRIILYRRNESQRRISYSQPVRRIHFESSPNHTDAGMYLLIACANYI